MRNLRDLVTIRQAADMIGVSHATLRDCDRTGKLEAFDLMGNAMRVEAEGNGARVQLAAERPLYLRVRGESAGLLEQALARARVQDKAPVAVTARASGRDITVTVTSQSQRAQDGVVEILPSADAASEGWPAPQHFCSLAPAESRSFSIALSGAAAARQVRVRVGDREMREVMAEVTGG